MTTCHRIVMPTRFQDACDLSGVIFQIVDQVDDFMAERHIESASSVLQLAGSEIINRSVSLGRIGQRHAVTRKINANARSKVPRLVERPQKATLIAANI